MPTARPSEVYWPVASVLTILEKLLPFLASIRTSAPLTGCPAGSFTTPSKADVPAQALNVTRNKPTKLILYDLRNISAFYSFWLTNRGLSTVFPPRAIRASRCRGTTCPRHPTCHFAYGAQVITSVIGVGDPNMHGRFLEYARRINELYAGRMVHLSLFGKRRN